MLDTTGYVNFKKIACQPSILRKYVIFQMDVNVDEVSSMLCDIDNELVPEITDYLVTQINIAAIIRIVSTVS